MELETLRVTDENSTHKKDVKPIRFKNWDLVSHDEIMRYFPVMTTDPTVFKHHLLHHFLEEKKAGLNIFEITSRILRVQMELVNAVCSLESRLSFVSIFP